MMKQLMDIVAKNRDSWFCQRYCSVSSWDDDDDETSTDSMKSEKYADSDSVLFLVWYDENVKCLKKWSTPVQVLLGSFLCAAN